MTTITALFDTRREAELAIEHLVQEHDIDRDDIVVATEGDDNSAGLEANGSDRPAIGEDADDEGAALSGGIYLHVTIDDEDVGETVQNVLLEYGGSEITDAD